LVWQEGEEKGRPHLWLAELIDRRMHQAIRIWPSQVWAAQQLFKMNSSMLNDGASDWDTQELSESDAKLCFQRVKGIQEELSYLPFTADEIHRKWCEITVMPLLNHKCALESSITV
jgi:hypothetical protein